MSLGVGSTSSDPYSNLPESRILLINYINISAQVLEVLIFSAIEEGKFSF